MEMAQFLAGLAMGYRLGRMQIEDASELSVEVLDRKLLSISIGRKSGTDKSAEFQRQVNPDDLVKLVVQDEHLWDKTPYYSGWLSDIDKQVLEAGLRDGA